MTDTVTVSSTNVVTIVDTTINTLEVANETVLSVEDKSVEIIAVAQQGPAGPAGPPGSAGTQFLELVADVALGGHRAVIATATGCDYADNTDATHTDKIIGVTSGAVSQGSLAYIVTTGELNGFSGLIKGSPVYASTNGTLTQTVPTSGFVQKLGVAIAADTCVIQIQPPIQLV